MQAIYLLLTPAKESALSVWAAQFGYLTVILTALGVIFHIVTKGYKAIKRIDDGVDEFKQHGPAITKLTSDMADVKYQLYPNGGKNLIGKLDGVVAAVANLDTKVDGVIAEQTVMQQKLDLTGPRPQHRKGD